MKSDEYTRDARRRTAAISVVMLSLILKSKPCPGSWGRRRPPRPIPRAATLTAFSGTVADPTGATGTEHRPTSRRSRGEGLGLLDAKAGTPPGTRPPARPGVKQAMFSADIKSMKRSVICGKDY